MTKNPWLVFRLKHKFSKQNFFGFSFMEKKACHTISLKKLVMLFSYYLVDKKIAAKAQILIAEYGKNACYKISLSAKNAYFAIFIHLLLLYERV